MSTSALEPCGGACRHDGVAYCLARGPSWVCTLAAGHAGDHIACTGSQHAVDRWANAAPFAMGAAHLDREAALGQLLRQALTALDAPTEVLHFAEVGDLNNLSLWLITEAKPKDIEIGHLQMELRDANKLLEHHRGQCIERAIADRDVNRKMQALEMILQSFVAGANTEEIDALVKGAIATMHLEAENFVPGSDLTSADRVVWEGFTKGIVAGIAALAPDLHETLKGAVEEAINGIHHRHPEVPIHG